MPDLLSRWTSEAPTSPRLTWYGRHGQRVELSGRVLANWVVKVTHLLTDLADAGPNTRVTLDLPPHWRSLVWALGTWTAGGAVVLPDAPAEARGGRSEAVVTNDPARWPDEAIVLAQDMGDLAMRWSGDPLPPGVVDAAAEVMTYPDHLGRAPVPHDTDPALVAADGIVAHCGLTAWALARRSQDWMEGDGSHGRNIRVMAAPSSLSNLLALALVIWGDGGSLVVISPSTNDSDRARIAEQEGVTGAW